MSNYLDRRLAVWLNTYRDNKFLFDELTARTADKWLGEFFTSDLVPYLEKCGVKVDGPERYENGQLVFGYVAYL